MSKLRQKIEENYKKALKSRKELEVHTLRLIKSAIKDKDIAIRTEGKKNLSDQDLLTVFQTLIKQRKESLEMYKKANRDNLVKKELDEINIIKSFLPYQLDEDEISEVIKNIIQNHNLNSLRDMGTIMGILKNKYSGQIDLSLAGKVAKNILG